MSERCFLSAPGVAPRLSTTRDVRAGARGRSWILVQQSLRMDRDRLEKLRAYQLCVRRSALHTISPRRRRTLGSAAGEQQLVLRERAARGYEAFASSNSSSAFVALSRAQGIAALVINLDLGALNLLGHGLGALVYILLLGRSLCLRRPWKGYAR